MEYTEAIEWVHSLKRLSTTASRINEGCAVPELQQMRKLMVALGSPQRRLRFIHVAGTNGKGSTVTMLASILREAGYKTGANISPYVLDFRERFQINGEMISEQTLAGVLTLVRNAASKLAFPPIEFEAVTAAALVYFAQEQCDVVCLETGIGGRLDSTNMIENTLVACITQIGFDHTELLGDSLEAIAREKCGIFKNNCAVICFPLQAKEVAAEILRCANKEKCALSVPSMQDFHFYKGEPFTNRVYYGGYTLDVPFPGRHQALNASVALEAALSLWRQGFTIDDEDIVNGIANARFPGRIEIVRRDPLVILDGAHNEDSAKALARTLRGAGMKNMTAVVGVLQDKHAEKILTYVAPYIKRLYLVTPETPRALPAKQLAAIADGLVEYVEVCGSVSQAIEQARENPGEGIVFFGSFYLVAQVKKQF